MKFRDLSNNIIEDGELAQEYASAHGFGALRIGGAHLFFRAGLKNYCIAFSDISGCFRRIRSVEANLCCGRGNFETEYLVVCTGGREAAEIMLPGKKAARSAFAELKQKLPGADFSVPGENGAKG